jgi:endo-1,4-beta-D-glucanase Y
MNWKYSIDGIGLKGSGSATDADEDVAFALYLASKVWSGNSSHSGEAKAPQQHQPILLIASHQRNRRPG